MLCLLRTPCEGYLDDFNENTRNLLPYMDMLADYYNVIYDYIDELFELFEEDILKFWIYEMDCGGMKGFNTLDISENGTQDNHHLSTKHAIATFLWTACIVHSADHWTYTEIFDKFGLYASVVPYKRWGTVDEVLNGKWLSRTQWHIAKSRSFMNNYTYYRTSFLLNDRLMAPDLYNGWKNVPDFRTRIKCNEIVQRFRQNMIEMNENWKNLMHFQHFNASVSH